MRSVGLATLPNKAKSRLRRIREFETGRCSSQRVQALSCDACSHSSRDIPSLLLLPPPRSPHPTRRWRRRLTLGPSRNNPPRRLRVSPRPSRYSSSPPVLPNILRQSLLQRSILIPTRRSPPTAPHPVCRSSRTRIAPRRHRFRRTTLGPSRRRRFKQLWGRIRLQLRRRRVLGRV